MESNLKDLESMLTPILKQIGTETVTQVRQDYESLRSDFESLRRTLDDRLANARAEQKNAAELEKKIAVNEWELKSIGDYVEHFRIPATIEQCESALVDLEARLATLVNQQEELDGLPESMKDRNPIVTMKTEYERLITITQVNTF